ncbi:unnamed protein product [Brachionus calyciflorus]|uniref:Uncharacterized protein n=1 Tax=Brachionus calyciflorus TaxID=104777 RepID=A0A813TSQ7_9BILA|nr:unnamed protein product [Brachionus calyciflorus]
MKNRYSSIESMKTKNDDYYINSKKDLIIRLKYPKTEPKEIYDLDYLTLFKSGSYPLNDSCSIRSNGSSNFSNSSSTSLNTSGSKLDNVSRSDESFTFQDFVSSILNNENKEYHNLIIQDIARLIELKFREFKKKFSSQKNLQQILNTSSIYLNTDSDLFIKIAECVFQQASEEPNGILGAKLKLNLMYDDDKFLCISDSFPYDSTTLPTSEIIVNLKYNNNKRNGDSNNVGNFGFIKKCLKYFHSKYYQHVFVIDSKDFDIFKNRLY